MWLGTIVLGGVLLALALIGGTWGTSYAAHSNDGSATPLITSIVPTQTPTEGPNFSLIINGSGFGIMVNTRVRFYQWGGEFFELSPLTVSADRITVDVPANLTAVPNMFDVVVVIYTSSPPDPTIPTMPTIPIIPTKPIIPTEPGADISNQVTFTAYEPIYFYLPVIKKQ